VTRYTLSRIAQADLVEIRDYYLQQGSPRAARKMLVEFVRAFRLIGKTPHLGHERRDLAEGRPVLFWPLRDYLIIYRAGRKPIEIVAVVHGSRDVPALLKRVGRPPK
jgi:plasmid stabilization system protein ParE